MNVYNYGFEQALWPLFIEKPSIKKVHNQRQLLLFLQDVNLCEADIGLVKAILDTNVEKRQILD